MIKFLIFVDGVAYRCGGVFAKYWYLLALLGALCFFRYDAIEQFVQQHEAGPLPPKWTAAVIMVAAPFFPAIYRWWPDSTDRIIESWFEMKKKREED